MVGVRRRRHAVRVLSRRATALVVLTATLLLVFAGGAFAGYRYDRHSIDRILPGVRIDGVDVGGMTRDQAIVALSSKASAILSRPISVQGGTRQWTTIAGSLGTMVDINGAVDEALGLAASLSWPARVYRRLLHKTLDRNVPLPVDYDPADVNRLVHSIAGQLTTQPQNALLDFRQGHVVVRHAKPGMALSIAAAEATLSAALRSPASSVGLPVKATQPAVPDSKLGMTILVRISQLKLCLYRGTKLVKTYPVATGMLGTFDTPQGHWHIVRKRVNPSWGNPAPDGWARGLPDFVPPGPDNPLGTRAMDLDAPGLIRIHGTPDDASIGHHASHGCVRMHIPDAEDLFNRVSVGTPVIIAW